jgi:cob(I)alamin adenosyltransferase
LTAPPVVGQSGGRGTQHVVITHRDLIEATDLVTDTTKIKHPMDAGRKGQQGIEW